MKQNHLESNLFTLLKQRDLIDGYEPGSGLAIVRNPNSSEIADTIRQSVYNYLRKPGMLRAIRETTKGIIRYTGHDFKDLSLLVGHGCLVQVAIKHVEGKEYLPTILIGETPNGVIIYIVFRQSLYLDINGLSESIASLFSPTNIHSTLL